MMNRGLIRQLIIALFTLVLSGCGEQTKEVRLVFKFPVDKVFHYTYDSKNSSVVYENDKKTISDERSNRIAYSQEALKTIDDTTSRLLFSYSQTDNDGKTQDNWSTECTMLNDGKIIDFTPDGDISDQSLEYYRRLFEQTAPIYPHDLVPEGYSWTNSYKVMLDNGMTEATTTYKIKALAREAGYDCAVIEYKGNIIIPLGDDPMGDGSVKISGTDRINVDGVTYFSYTEGILVRQEEKSHLIRSGTQLKEGKTTAFRIEENRNGLTRLVDITTK
jgi:hypothetical protein